MDYYRVRICMNDAWLLLERMVSFSHGPIFRQIGSADICVRHNTNFYGKGFDSSIYNGSEDSGLMPMLMGHIYFDNHEFSNDRTCGAVIGLTRRRVRISPSPARRRTSLRFSGTANDPDGDSLTYRWLEGSTELSSWQPVGSNGEAYLDLSQVPLFGIGEHILTLEVSDGQSTSADDMILTIGNSRLIQLRPVAEFIHMALRLRWAGRFLILTETWWIMNGGRRLRLLFSGQVQTIHQGAAVDLPAHVLSGLGLGEHTITLCVNDNVNASVCNDILVSIIDTSAPSIAPVPSKTILWPPNHKMVDITIVANASDNSGGPVTLAASVSSNEPEDGLGDGDMAPDWTDASDRSGERDHNVAASS